MNKTYYGLTGTCRGCKRVSFACRRDRRCRRYNTRAKPGHYDYYGDLLAAGR